MKRAIIVVLFVCICALVSAQAFKVLPTLSAEYCTSEAYKVNDQPGIHLPNLSTSLGVNAGYMGLSVIFDNKFWADPPINGKTINGFIPTQSLFHAELKYKVYRGVVVGIEHDCWHPISVSGRSAMCIYGGKTGMYISFNKN